MITLGITNIRPGSVDRGYEHGVGRGIFDRWEMKFTLVYRDGRTKQSTRLVILPRDIEPMAEALHDGVIYRLAGVGPAPFVARYFREDSCG